MLPNIAPNIIKGSKMRASKTPCERYIPKEKSRLSPGKKNRNIKLDSKNKIRLTAIYIVSGLSELRNSVNIKTL